MKINIQDVNINPGELEKIILSLEGAIARNIKVKELCEEILSVQKAAGSKAGRNSKNGRPRGGKTLAQAISEILKKRRKPMRPIDLKNRVLAAGYKTSAKPQSFYTAVFNTAKQIPGIVKTREGFSLPAKKTRGAAARKKRRGKK
jgi:hypothetical protein